MVSSYDKTQPIATDDLKVSSPKLVSNFEAIEDYISKDHVSLNDNTSNAGLHDQVTYVKKTSDPVTATDLGESYTKSLGSNDNLVFKAGNDGNIAHLSAIKAWGLLTGTAGGTILSSHNITSYVVTGISKKITFTKPMIDTNYIAIIQPYSYVNSLTKAVGSLTINSTTSPSSNFSVVIIGN